jgi:hypothetical protein
LVIVMSGFAVAHACNVPVFRFALERWRPDPYRVTVFHRGPPSDADRVLVDRLADQQDKSLINLVVRTIDVSSLDDEADKALMATLGQPSLPALVVQYPAHLQLPMPIWSGFLNAEAIAQLSDSPIRAEVVRRLAEGQTAVWLLLECGQPDKDDRAARLVEEQLKQLEQELKLPELTDAPADKLLTGTPLQVAFSIVRVPRSAAEQPLVQMLLHAESDLLERSDPMVFPVFGRGRALLPLIGAGVTAENIHDSAAFLVGACSCEVKEMNPGFDLLLAADWDSLLTQDGVPLTATASGDRHPPGEAELVPIPAGSSAGTAASSIAVQSQPSSSAVGINPTLVRVSVISLGIVVLIAMWLVSGRDSPRE